MGNDFSTRAAPANGVNMNDNDESSLKPSAERDNRGRTADEKHNAMVVGDCRCSVGERNGGNCSGFEI
jgi:hypothetical protein